jgi:ADP-heptose:LPS heptosyltransferase
MGGRAMGYGDDLMITGAARVMQQRDPRRVRPMLRNLPQRSAVYLHNPRIAGPDERGSFQLLHCRDQHENRPYHCSKSKTRWGYNLNFRPERGELYFSEAERAFGEMHAGRVVIEPNIKPSASPNKQWGRQRWQALAHMVTAAGLRPVQLGPPGTLRLEGVDLIETNGFREACAVLARARAAVLPEGGLHHAAAACNVPAVVIFGGFTPVELTGYAGHINLGASLGEACGWRIRCAHCEAAMAAIEPHYVMDQLEALL